MEAETRDGTALQIEEHCIALLKDPSLPQHASIGVHCHGSVYRECTIPNCINMTPLTMYMLNVPGDRTLVTSDRHNLDCGLN